MTAIIEHQSTHRQIEALCASFPSLQGRPGTKPWSALKLAKVMSGGQSEGEKLAAAFVLAVWNGFQPADGGWWNEPHATLGRLSVGRFDAIHALAIWDQEHREAFLAWCEHPFWP